MTDYIIPVTEALVEKGVLGKSAAAKADSYLAQLDTESVIRSRVMAAMTELPISQVERILGEYANHGVLRGTEMIECESCRTLSPAEDVDIARTDGDEYPCDGGCGGDLTLQKPTVTLAYQLLDTPA